MTNNESVNYFEPQFTRKRNLILAVGIQKFIGMYYCRLLTDSLEFKSTCIDRGVQSNYSSCIHPRTDCFNL